MKITSNEETEKTTKICSPRKKESSNKEIADSLLSPQQFYNKSIKVKPLVEKQHNEHKESVVQNKETINDIKDIKIQTKTSQDVSNNK